MSKKFYPVIHCVRPLEFSHSFPHAIRNVRMAKDCGADGAFLIGHEMGPIELVEIYKQVQKNVSDFFLGVNFLNDYNQTSWDTMRRHASMCPNLSAVWTDYLPREKVALPGIQFCVGVAFKYLNPSQSGESLASDCEHATNIADVVTTTGDRTGQPPSLEKIKVIHGHIRQRSSLAIASGMSEENVGPYLPYVDMFLVASSLVKVNEHGHDELIPEKVQAFADKVHSFKD